MHAYIELLQGYYKFLSLGKFFETEAKIRLLSLSEPLSIPTGDHTKFSINPDLTTSLLHEIHTHPTSKNVFGYLAEISAFRGIFGVMREMIEKEPNFRISLQTLLGDQYFPFEQTIRFLRNVLSHSSTPSLLIHQEDFQKQKDFLLTFPLTKGGRGVQVQPEERNIKKGLILLHFVYKAHLPQREGSADYACDTQIDFSSLKAGTSLRKIISLHQMYLLAELCYNITKIINAALKKRSAAKPQPFPSKKKPLLHKKRPRKRKNKKTSLPEVNA